MYNEIHRLAEDLFVCHTMGLKHCFLHTLKATIQQTTSYTAAKHFGGGERVQEALAQASYLYVQKHINLFTNYLYMAEKSR